VAVFDVSNNDFEWIDKTRSHALLAQIRPIGLKGLTVALHVVPRGWRKGEGTVGVLYFMLDVWNGLAAGSYLEVITPLH
jgi:hypothetical protein